MDWWLVVLILGEFAFVGWIIWIVAHYKKSKNQQRMEERSRLLERFNNAEELMRFMERGSGGGFEDLLPRSPAPRPSGPILAAAVGIVILFMGMAFAFLVWFMTGEDAEGILVPAVLCLTGGVGVLVAAAVSAYFYRKLGLYERHDSAPQQGER